MSAVLIKEYPAPDVDLREILRYAGAKEDSDEAVALLEECVREALPKLTYKVCYLKTRVRCEGDNVTLEGAFSLSSRTASKMLDGFDEAVIFCATVGIDLDRLIARYSRTLPSRALMLSALGAERIEALCDAFCRDIGGERRFSPGYGDLSLDIQKDIFSLLACQNKIGLCLSESLIMSPSKSVSAIIGISNDK